MGVGCPRSDRYLNSKFQALSLLKCMGVGTSRTLGVQGAGVLCVILPHGDNEAQLWFLGGKCRMTGMGRDLYHTYHFATATHILRNCHCWPHQRHTKLCFDRANSGYCLPPMGQTRIRTREISENRNVSHPYDFFCITVNTKVCQP